MREPVVEKALLELHPVRVSEGSPVVEFPLRSNLDLFVQGCTLPGASRLPTDIQKAKPGRRIESLRAESRHIKQKQPDRRQGRRTLTLSLSMRAKAPPQSDSPLSTRGLTSFDHSELSPVTNRENGTPASLQLYRFQSHVYEQALCAVGVYSGGLRKAQLLIVFARGTRSGRDFITRISQRRRGFQGLTAARSLVEAS